MPLTRKCAGRSRGEEAEKVPITAPLIQCIKVLNSDHWWILKKQCHEVSSHFQVRGRWTKNKTNTGIGKGSFNFLFSLIFTDVIQTVSRSQSWVTWHALNKVGLICWKGLFQPVLYLMLKKCVIPFSLHAVCSAILLYRSLLSLVILHPICLPYPWNPRKRKTIIHTAGSGTQMTIPEGDLPSVRPVFISFQQGQQAALCPLGQAIQMQVPSTQGETIESK